MPQFHVSEIRFNQKVYVVLAAVLLAVLGLSAAYHFATMTSEVIEVKEKEAVGGQSGQYLIYTESEVYENRDSLWGLKFNSSDVYNRIEPGRCYRANVWGWRVPVLSMYRGIGQVEETACGQ